MPVYRIPQPERRGGLGPADTPPARLRERFDLQEKLSTVGALGGAVQLGISVVDQFLQEREAKKSEQKNLADARALSEWRIKNIQEGGEGSRVLNERDQNGDLAVLEGEFTEDKADKVATDLFVRRMEEARKVEAGLSTDEAKAKFFNEWGKSLAEEQQRVRQHLDTNLDFSVDKRHARTYANALDEAGAAGDVVKMTELITNINTLLPVKDQELKKAALEGAQNVLKRAVGNRLNSADLDEVTKTLRDVAGGTYKKALGAEGNEYVLDQATNSALRVVRMTQENVEALAKTPLLDPALFSKLSEEIASSLGAATAFVPSAEVVEQGLQAQVQGLADLHSGALSLKGEVESGVRSAPPSAAGQLASRYAELEVVAEIGQAGSQEKAIMAIQFANSWALTRPDMSRIMDIVASDPAAWGILSTNARRVQGPAGVWIVEQMQAHLNRRATPAKTGRAGGGGGGDGEGELGSAMLPDSPSSALTIAAAGEADKFRIEQHMVSVAPLSPSESEAWQRLSTDQKLQQYALQRAEALVTEVIEELGVKVDETDRRTMINVAVNSMPDVFRGVMDWAALDPTQETAAVETMENVVDRAIKKRIASWNKEPLRNNGLSSNPISDKYPLAYRNVQEQIVRRAGNWEGTLEDGFGIDRDLTNRLYPRFKIVGYEVAEEWGGVDDVPYGARIYAQGVVDGEPTWITDKNGNRVDFHIGAHAESMFSHLPAAGDSFEGPGRDVEQRDDQPFLPGFVRRAIRDMNKLRTDAPKQLGESVSVLDPRASNTVGQVLAGRLKSSDMRSNKATLAMVMAGKLPGDQDFSAPPPSEELFPSVKYGIVLPSEALSWRDAIQKYENALDSRAELLRTTLPPPAFKRWSANEKQVREELEKAKEKIYDQTLNHYFFNLMAAEDPELARTSEKRREGEVKEILGAADPLVLWRDFTSFLKFRGVELPVEDLSPSHTKKVVKAWLESEDAVEWYEQDPGFRARFAPSGW